VRILALETAEMAGSVAALEGPRVLAERWLDAAQRSAQSLAPAVSALLAEVGWQPTDVQLVAVTTGPGSFTSLRIGVTTAKAFAYAAGCEILGASTLEVIACRAPAEVAKVIAVMDAQRQQVFTATFERAASEWECREPTAIVDNSAWLAGLRAGDVVSGTGLSKLADRLPAGVLALDPSLWAPTAEATGQLAWQKYRTGQRDDVFTLLPQYYRRTAAEEQREKRVSG
jgi:tRNA threonylcarbamoyladenosine biosynthesis protein TsaB